VRGAPRTFLVLLLAAGCAGQPRIKPEQLPAEPIVFLYLEAEKARELAERIQKRDAAARTDGTGVARLNELAKLFRSSDDLMSAEFLGRPSLLDPRTAEVQPFESLPRGSRPLEWSQDRKRLLFATPRFDVYQLSELDQVSGEVRIFTQRDEDHPSGSLAPDGTLVFSEVSGSGSQKGLEAKLYIRSPGGGEPQPLTPGPADISPAFSPDGRRLVYQTRAADGQLAISMLDPVRGTPKLVARGRDPVFTPDGEWIVYSQQLAAGFRLWRMRPDGSGRLALGAAPVDVGDETHPAVSPDGRYVAYMAEKDGRRSLRIRRFDGGGDRLLLESGDGLLPVW
jgi:Tol biopolymer transport system component